MTYTVLEVVAAGIVRAEGIYLNAPETAATPSEIRYTMLGILENNKLPLDEAQDVIDTIIGSASMRTLYGLNVNGFTLKLAECLMNPDTMAIEKEYNFLSYAKSVSDDIKETNSINEMLCTSRHVGEVKDVIHRNLKILKCSYVDGNDRCGGFYVATAVDENGDGFSFSPKTFLEKTADYSVKLKGKVKSHKQDKFWCNALITTLFYCKIS